MALAEALRCAPAPIGAEVLVAADTMAIPDGLRLGPGNPIYYRFAQTQQSLGNIVAGIKLPAAAKVESAVVAELTKQGFVRAKTGGPNPSIYLLAVVGDANFTFGWGGASCRSCPEFKDKPIVEAIIGVNEAQTLSSEKRERLALADNEDRYYVTVIAFDVALMARKEKRVLWRTSMSIRFSDDFEVTLPTMLASGGPFFGRDLKEPEFMGDSERRKADVEIGDLIVVPDEKKPDSKESKKEMGR